MNKNEIVVLASAKSKPGSETRLIQTVKAAIKPTHAESGCLKYAFHQSVEDPLAFVMIEKWISKEALDQHLAAPHIQELFKKLPELLAEPMKIQVFKAIPEGSSAKLL